ncbi:Gfo/Idh/MocA family oxidoreductase [bacterium]|nr:Gfo/Idh/MocA family oxidoreductase [bacterium]
MATVPGLGIVGGGVWASHHMNAVRDLEAEGRAKLVAMCARTQETVDKMTSEWKIDGTRNYDELIAREDIHAISVVTPDHLHRDMAIKAMRAGKHVICEKPMDLTVEGCDEMNRVARETGRLLFVDFHKRYDQVQQKTREFILQGKIGTVQYGNCYMEDTIVVPRDWFPKWAEATTPFWFIGVHQIDMLRWSLGQEVVRVNSAKGWKGKLSGLGLNTYDSVHAELEFSGGAVFSVDISWILPETFPAVVNQGARFVGSEGVLELDTQDRGFSGCFSGGGMKTFNVNSAHVQPLALGGSLHSGYFVDPIKDFMRLVTWLEDGGDIKQLEGKYPSGQDGRAATAAALAVHQCLETGKPVDVMQ